MRDNTTIIMEVLKESLLSPRNDRFTELVTQRHPKTSSNVATRDLFPTLYCLYPDNVILFYGIHSLLAQQR